MNGPAVIDASVINGVCRICGCPVPEAAPADPVPASDATRVLIRMCADCSDDFEAWRAAEPDAQRRDASDIG